MGTGLSLLQPQPRRVFGPLPQAEQRGFHVLDDKSKVRRVGPLQDPDCSSQRGANKDPVP